MDLSNLVAPRGANKNRTRKGRGHGSTLGKTAGKGHKGQKARSGGGVGAGFEGGQTPLHRRLPKIGFTNVFAKEVVIVNLGDLERVYAEGEEVTVASLVERRVVRGSFDSVKILGNGELTKKLKVQAHKFSKSAQDKIVGVGGSVEVI